jgi:hypothetical protein
MEINVFIFKIAVFSIRKYKYKYKYFFIKFSKNTNENTPKKIICKFFSNTNTQIYISDLEIDFGKLI